MYRLVMCFFPDYLFRNIGNRYSRISYNKPLASSACIPKTGKIAKQRAKSRTGRRAFCRESSIGFGFFRVDS